MEKNIAAINNMLERRSVRKFKPDAVADGDLETIVKCGAYAASSLNSQPWRFTVIKNKAVIHEINEKCKENVPHEAEKRMRERGGENYDIFYGAPVVIIVSGCGAAGSYETDCANAAHNICLAANALGLGSCFNAMFMAAFRGPSRAELIKRLDIPGDYSPVFSVALGYADMPNPPAPPRKADAVNYIN